MRMILGLICEMVIREIIFGCAMHVCVTCACITGMYAAMQHTVRARLAAMQDNS